MKGFLENKIVASTEVVYKKITKKDTCCLLWIKA